MIKKTFAKKILNGEIRNCRVHKESVFEIKEIVLKTNLEDKILRKVQQEKLSLFIE